MVPAAQVAPFPVPVQHPVGQVVESQTQPPPVQCVSPVQAMQDAPLVPQWELLGGE